MNKNIAITAFVVILVLGLFALVYVSLEFINTKFKSSETAQNDNDRVMIAKEAPRDMMEGYVPPSGPPPAVDYSPTKDYASIRLQLQAIMIEIELMTATAATQVSECRLLPLGHSPCGGPSFYHVYAIRGSNTSRLEALSLQHQTLAAELNQMTEAMGICMITPEPEILIANGSCVIQLN